jgi:subtilisin family serine protease
MLSKSFTTVLLASTTALAACGGGGGGGGGTPGTTPITITNLGSVNTNSISSGFASVIQQVSQDGMVDAKETVEVFEWVNANSNIDTAELAKYNVDINGTTYTLKQAWNMLKGYKALYYDGKEGFWSALVDSGEYNDENDTFVELKQLAQNDDPDFAEAIGKGEKTVEQFKDEKGIVEKPIPETPEEPVVEEPVEDTPVVEEPVEETPVEEEPVEQEPVVEEPVEETPEEEIPVEEEPVEEEPVDEVAEETPEEVVTIVSEETRTEAEYWLRLDKVALPEEIYSTDVESVQEGDYTVTYRVTTFITPETHTHVYATDTYTTTTYSDGSVVEELTLQALRYREPVTKYPTATQRVERLEIARDSTGKKQDDYVEESDHADMGTRTPGYVADAGHYQTDEFAYISNKQLSVSNFDVAYSRGWTGKGSTIVIADTGAYTGHTDLDGNIKHTKDFTGTGVATSSNHGTHVAGIAGAEKNGVGMHGAAFDADLAIAKVSGGSSYSFSNAIKAAEWGQSLGSAAINVSAEMNYDSAFRKSIVKQAEGVYYSTHWYYGEHGYNGAVNEAVKWKAALGNEQVLVKAAGNAGWDYSAGMNQMATATDANGNLILDGQMIVVGNWDQNNNKINGSSNKAGTVCATMQNGVCIDAAKIKDYYIMANGTAITSTAENGGYVTMSGTSMAAPVVTGAIAVLHQMWPHMKGKHLVQLVLVTGNKDIAGYDENVHGQGLLDMDTATRPVGATGIPTTGRTNGGVSAVAGGANVAGVAASQMQALTSVMVLDSFERDFYIDLGDMTQDVDTRTASVAEQMGAINYFAGYMNNDQHVAVPFALTENSNIEVGVGNSTGHYLGNSFQGTLGTTTDSNTVYANYNYTNGGFYAQAGIGYTSVNFDMNNSMMVDAENVISTTATAGYEFAPAEGHTLGFAVSQPVTVESAKFTYRVPTSRTLDGNVITELQTVDFRNSDREIDLGTYYKFDITKTGIKQVDTVTNMLGIQGNVRAFAELRNKIDSVSEIEKRGGINLNLNF